MAKFLIDVPLPTPAANTNPYPVIDRYTKATLPARGTSGKAVIVTDGTFAVSSGLGSAYVGGGTLLNVVYWNGGAWITI